MVILMKNLTAYEEQQNETLKSIYEAKKAVFKLKNGVEEYKVKTIVENKHGEIIERYAEYIKNKRQLENIDDSPCDDLEKIALIHCYENSTKSLNILKKGIKMNQPRALRSICNYCGINNPGTYDHYLPKSGYPEFSVYGPNLVPCCGECNGKKGDNWRSEDNKRYFFNFYYDEIPNLQIIESIVTIEDNEPKIKFQFIKKNGEFEYKNLENSFMIEKHYTILNLLDRYRDSCNSYIDETRNSLIAHKKYDEKSIIEFLSEEYVGVVETYGINHWKGITLKGMINSSGFVKYCRSI